MPDDLRKKIHAALKTPAGKPAADLAVAGALFHKSFVEHDPFGGIDVEELYQAFRLLGERTSNPLNAFVGAWKPEMRTSRTPPHQSASFIEYWMISPPVSRILGMAPILCIHSHPHPRRTSLNSRRHLKNDYLRACRRNTAYSLSARETSAGKSSTVAGSLRSRKLRTSRSWFNRRFAYHYGSHLSTTIVRSSSAANFAAFQLTLA